MLPFAFYSLLRFNTNIDRLDVEVDVSCRSPRQCINQFTRTLDASVLNLILSVEIDEIYVSAGIRHRERDECCISVSSMVGRHEAAQAIDLVVGHRASGADGPRSSA